MKIKLLTSAALAALVALAIHTSTATAADPGFNSNDKSFLEDAYQDGLAEVKMAELALAKTAHADVKEFAGHMVIDHGKANTELKGLADSKKVAVASEPSLAAQGKAKMADAKSGADFDKEYAESMVSAHKKAIELFEKASGKVGDPEVKAFVDKTLPTLREHLAKAEALQGKVGK